MNFCCIKNLCDGPRDYPLKNGESIYLAPRASVQINKDNVSEALVLAQHKGLVLINDVVKEVDE